MKASCACSEVTGVISDWISENVSAFVEVVNADRVSTSLSSRNKTFSQWITIRADNNTFVYNGTTGQCDKSNSSLLQSFPQLSKITKNLTSMSSLIKGLVDFSNKYRGKLSSNKIVAGIEGVYWVSCADGVDGSINLQVEVVFAGKKSFEPPTYDNPLVLFVQIAEYGNFSDNSTLISQLSLTFNSYDLLSEDDNRLFMPPPGVICNGWKEEQVPVNFSDPFSVLIEVTDDQKHHYESIVHYSASQKVVMVKGARKDGIIPFINEQNVPDNVITVVHDFSTGYEYQLDHSQCVNLSALPSESEDVVVSNSTYTMRPVLNILLSPEISFGNYGKLMSENGRLHTVYRGIKNKTNEKVEVHLDGDQLYSYTIFKNVGKEMLISSNMRLTPTPYTTIDSVMENMQGCFAQSAHTDSSNSTFTIDVRSKSLKDVYEHGIGKVTLAIAKALSEVAPVNPLRVRAFFDSGNDNLLRVFFSVEEKTDIKPSLVPGYNYTAEVPTLVLIEKLNGTVSHGDWKFSVSTSGMNAEEWVVAAKSLRRYTPSSPDPITYYGYTGGAMFVLGVFTLVLGVGIGAGGVFFVTRRQRISNLAYQVFE
ncbi:hypothetical protein DICVIV_05621 [Dictyocaulus viviparus]|uniref:Uncharacterized protein n=1 Tax=Dictyocaulus viviparus TaxID=29172 RepID=A0A0D8XWX5_DICVI|nr:hypothetical protein DICVIV_05621 [Dictyocaulus viviparus]